MQPEGCDALIALVQSKAGSEPVEDVRAIHTTQGCVRPLFSFRGPGMSQDSPGTSQGSPEHSVLDLRWLSNRKPGSRAQNRFENHNSVLQSGGAKPSRRKPGRQRDQDFHAKAAGQASLCFCDCSSSMFSCWAFIDVLTNM